jgi:chromosome partitioning protein
MSLFTYKIKGVKMIIAVSHSKGGVGKSTISFNLAVTLSKWFKVELVDLDFQQNTTKNNARRGRNGLKPLPILTFNNIDKYKNYVRNDSDDKVSVVDVGGFDSDINRLVILTSDIVITPVSEEVNDLEGLQHFNGILEKMSNKVGQDINVNVVLNAISPHKTKLEKLKKHIQKSERFNLLDSVLRRRADYSKGLGVGKSVIEFNKESKASDEFLAFAKEIKKLIKGK